MANTEPKMIHQLGNVTQLAADSLLVAVLTPTGVTTTVNIALDDFFANVVVDAKFTSVTTAELVMSNNTTPASSSANATQGEIWSDGTYLYVATDLNTIKRVALSAF